MGESRDRDTGTPFMTYRFTTGPERWMIDVLKPDHLGRWQLYHAVDESWKELRLFSTAEAAMMAVAAGKTGVDAWDAATHDPAEFTAEKWSAEGW
jgi:hypothetical protein